MKRETATAGAYRPRLAVVLPGLAIAVSVAGATPGKSAEAFDALMGSWSGGGVARFAGGETERLRCTAHYAGGGARLSLTLKCASASAQINLVGGLDAKGERITGAWSESAFGQSGDVTGTTHGGSVQLQISGGATGTMTLNVAGDRHTVSVATEDMSLSGVNVALARK